MPNVELHSGPYWFNVTCLKYEVTAVKHVVTPYSMVNWYQPFGGHLCLHLWDINLLPSRWRDGGRRFAFNIGTFPPNYTM
jgi:hypothetical protein